MARRLIYLVATFMLSALGIVAVAPAAWAHATLEVTSPADGVILPKAPTEVTATFDEPVGVSSDSLQVFAPNGGKVTEGATTHGSKPSEIVVKLKSGLDKGTYTVGWHVISADSHPVQGAWTFSIVAPSSTSVNAKSLNLTSSPVVGFMFGLTRWLAFCCFALLMGAVAFVLWCWPGGASSPLVLRLTMIAWSGLAASVLGALMLQGVYGAGEGVAKVFWPNVLHATLYSRYGRSLGIRLILVVVALFVFTSILGRLREDDSRVSVKMSVTWGVLAAALAATWAAADHAGVGIQVPLALASDIIHLSSVALWLGGLTMLAAIVLRRSRTSGGRKGRAAAEDTIQAVERFSPIALGCVVAIVLTGTYQAWRGVGTWPALVDTTYGRLLLIKIGAMLTLIGLGYVARIRIAALRAPASELPVRTVEWVAAGLPNVRALVGARPGHGRLGSGGRLHDGAANDVITNGHGDDGAAFRATANGSSNGARSNGARSNGAKSNGAGSNGAGSNGASLNGSPDAGRAAVTLGRLRWSVAAEAMIAVAVLGITSILVNTATARESFTQPASASVAFNTGGPGGRGTVAVTVTPAAPGPNLVRVTITNAAGKPYQPKQLVVAFELPARHLGPLSVTLDPAGPGRYVSKQPVPVSVVGKWQLQITIRSDAFDETSVIIPVTIN